MPIEKRTRPLFMSLTPDDIEDRFYVVVTINPIMPNQAMQQAQLAQAFRTPGADGRPLTSDRYIRENVLELEHPDIEDQRIDQQLLPAQNQEVSKIVQAAALADWKDENKETVKKADKILNPEGLPPIRPEDLQKVQQILQMLEQGADPNVLMQMFAQAEGGLMPAGMMGAMGAPGMAPGGPPPTVMPSQMQMQPEDALPDPATLPAKQARRGKAAN